MLDVHVDLVDLEEVLPVLGVGGGQLHAEGEALAAEEQVRDALVGEGGEAALALDVEGHVAQVHLHAADLDVERVLVAARELLAAPAEEVVAGDLEHVWHEVVALEHEVLDDGVHLVVRVLDARDRDVGHVFEDGRDDDFGQVFDEVWLELRLALLVVAEVSE